jgi:CubicO group peptidase (beta-lactamase class C family)
VLFEHAAGKAGPPGRESPCNAATVFDLASLTKPLVTVALVLDLLARGRLFFDTRVADLLPSFADGDDPRRGQVSIRHLLRHDAGLPAYRRFFEAFDGEPPRSSAALEARRERLLRLALAEPLERDPRAGSVYSDIGFLVLGAVVEEVGGARIDELARDRLFGPLGVEDAKYVDTLAGPPDRLAERCAATGPCPWRRREVHGVVQDENAYAMGGVASHAGLFATARSVHRLVAEWTQASAGRGLVLDRRLVGHAWDRSAGAAGAEPSTWALGWDTPSPGASSAGSRIGRGAVGHLGYTGTSIWVDPSRHAHVVLLTNRIAYGRSSDAIRALRPRIHDAVFAVLDRARH